MIRAVYIVLLVAVVSGSSCKTYNIPLDSFKAQMAEARKKPPRWVTTNSPGIIGGAMINSTYGMYDIDYISCVDKKGRRCEIKNGPAMQIRFTHDGKKKTSFYFDTMYLTDSTITGNRGRSLKMPKTIKISGITKVDVQDSKKYMRYVDAKKNQDKSDE